MAQTLDAKDLSSHRNTRASSDMHKGRKNLIKPPGKCLRTGRLNINEVTLAQRQVGLLAAFDSVEVRDKCRFVAFWIGADEFDGTGISGIGSAARRSHSS